MKKKTYADGVVDGYYNALKEFVKAYRKVMKDIEKKWGLIKEKKSE